MKSSNVFYKVGTDYHDNFTSIISDGKYFFALGDHIVQGRYEMCVEVSDQNGSTKDNDSRFESFEYFYDNSGNILYRMI